MTRPPCRVPPASTRRQDLDRAAAWAAIALVALGWLVVLRPPAAAPVPHCPLPCERPGADGRGPEVSCHGGPAAGAPLEGPARLLFGMPLDLARAPAASLEVLPGIGPARAAAIVDERERRAFDRVADLRRVHGIGPRTLEGLAGWVEVTPPHASGRAAVAPAR